MNSMKILHPGLLTTVQDKGRYGYQAFGVPVSGVMDRYSMYLANYLVGNNISEAVLEVTLMGPGIEFLCDTLIGVTGAGFKMFLNDEQVGINETIEVKKWDILSVRSPGEGIRGYIAFAGGIDVPVVMESKSTYIRGSFGGYKGRKLKEGDLLEIGKKPSKYLFRKIPSEIVKNIYEKDVLDTIIGPDIDKFTKEGIEVFLNSEYTITGQCDRMGYRLDGNKIEHADNADIISSPVQFGTVQVPGDGKPIVLMADRQTSGGYAKIGCVSSVDLACLSQKKPGDKIRFREISVEQAQRNYRLMNDKIGRLFDDTNTRTWVKTFANWFKWK